MGQKPHYALRRCDMLGVLPLQQIGHAMRTKLTTILTVIGAATILVLAANTVALATTGKAILAGKTSTSTKPTTLTRTTSGTTLVVKTKSTANAPFAVNGTGKVTNLNADKIDGLDSSVLAHPTWIYEYSPNVVAGASFKVVTPGMGAGTYLVSLGGVFDGSTDPGSEITCSVKASNPSRSLTQVFATGSGTYPINIVGSLKLAAPQVVTVGCTGPDSHYGPYEPLRLTLTRVSQVTTGSLVDAP